MCVCAYTVVWEYFVVKKFSWVMKPTKIYYTKNLTWIINKVPIEVFIYTCMCNIVTSKERINLKDLLSTSKASAIIAAKQLLRKWNWSKSEPSLSFVEGLTRSQSAFLLQVLINTTYKTLWWPIASPAGICWPLQKDRYP